MAQAQQQLWAQQLANIIADDNNPLKQTLVNAALDHDPSPLIQALTSNTAVNTAFQNLVTLIGHGIIHQQTTHQAGLTAWQDEKAQLEQLLHDTQASLNTAMAASATGSTNHPSRHQGVLPNKFSATKTAEKRQEAYRTWKIQVTSALQRNRTLYNTPLSQIQFLTELLEGNAFKRNRLAIENVIFNSSDPTRWTWQTTNDLFTTLDTQYETVDDRLGINQFNLIELGP